MPNFDLPGIVRYASSIGLALGVIALSLIFVLDGPIGSAEARPTAPVLRASALSKPLPTLTAADFNIARSVPVVVAGKIEPVTAALVRPAAPAAVETTTVMADAVNVRSGPSKAAPKTFVVRRGDVVEVRESDRGWSRIITPSGDTGWVWSSFLGG